MRKTGPGVRYLLGDHLGSTSVILDPNGGGSVATQRYYPYGRTRSGDVSSITDKQFTGHQKEAADLYFMQARFYDPYVGRFLAPDSIVPDPAEPQALNRYSYVNGNPLRYTDPTGHYYANLFQSLNYCLIGIGCSPAGPNGLTFAPNIFVNNRLDLPASFDQEFGCEELGTCNPYLPRGTGIGPWARLAYELTPIADIASAACGHTTCGLPGGRHVSNGERLLSLLALNPFGKGAKSATLLNLAEDAADAEDAMRAARRFEDAADGLVGPFADESILARGPGRDFTQGERAAINRIGAQTGCHTCGTKDPGTGSGNFVPDHQPPTALNVDGVPQRLYPQCIACSQVQGGRIAQFLKSIGRW